ncbi:hypothetical protein GALMADRAFT_1116695 [Galerina marginata CBS 339.88]|uniref:Uncharacterized protein n=1 Tax=Galerina marginata (strain CBS 339.88) TaxID=685588 RepID=A0A067TCQ0_GALM3|nr:hypothetical protein GALMADRAFT_1116695 [Galerina marginata CBS 339.88]
MAKADPHPAHPSPISSIPNEILAQIFLEGTNNWRDLRPLDLPFPIVVSATCFHWRLLAQGTPGLWTFIVPPLWQDESNCLQWTSDWLEKSAPLPISIVLDDRMGRSRRSADGTTKLVTETLALVVQSVDRLQRLDVSVAETITFEGSAHRLLSAPILQQLSLCFGDAYFSTSFSTRTDNKFNWLLSLPGMSKLRFENVVLPIPSNLTSLTARNLRIGYYETQSLFSASPYLKNLVLHDLLPAQLPVPDDYTPIQANSLHALAIQSHGIDGRLPIYFLRFLIIPNLRYLEVDGNTRVASILGSSITSSKITKLRISNCSRFFFLTHPTNSEQEIKFYHSLSAIQELELIHAPTEGIISTMALGHDTRSRNSTRRRSIERRYAPSHDDIVESQIADMTLGSNHRSQSDNIPWPELHIITLDTLLPGDVVRLVDFVKLHKNTTRRHDISTYSSP